MTHTRSQPAPQPPPPTQGRGRSAVSPVAGASRLKAYILASMYLITPAWALAAGFSAASQAPDSGGPGWLLIAALISFLIFIGQTTWVTVLAVSHMHESLYVFWSRRKSALIVFLMAGLVTATLSVSLLGPRSLVLLVLTVGTVWLLGLAPALRWRDLSIALTAFLVLAMLISVSLNWAQHTPILAGVIATFFFWVWNGLLVVTCWLNGWMLRVVQEIENARAQAAALAIAEERLRISRDLHDVFGRTLASVALKSELTAQLIAKGRTDEAEVQARAVREIAEQAGAQVRSVVSGSQRPDLGRELEGARALLNSAGIACTVTEHVQPAVLAADLGEAYGWVVREAVTNVIRHSEATWCRISLSGNEASGSDLIVCNDGATGHDDPAGSGLRGLRDRLSSLGGELSTGRHDGQFTVTAQVPARGGRS